MFNQKSVKWSFLITSILVLAACGEVGPSPSLSSSINSSSSGSSQPPVQYTITFKNYDDSVLSTQTVNQGSTVVYTGPTPKRPSTAQYSYTFTGWDQSITNVSSSFSTLAQYTQTTNTYTVTWEDYYGNILETDRNIPYGTTPTFNSQTPYRGEEGDYKFTFDTWSPTVSVVTENVTYVAQFTQSLNYIPITNAEELNNIRSNLSSNYRLMNDIDLNSNEWIPIGTEANPFTGTLDGKDFTITNLKISTSQTYVGLIGYNSGIVQNLKLSNVSINVNGPLTSDIYGGAFIGYGNGEAYNLHTLSGSIIIKRRADKKGYVGGIVGYQNTNLFNTTLTNKLNVTGDLTEATGGLIGFGRRISLDYSFNTGNVTGSITHTGGFVGYAGSGVTILNSYNSGSIEGTTANATTNKSVGGLIGFSVAETNIQSSYNQGYVSGYYEVGGLFGKTSGPVELNNVKNEGTINGSYEIGGFIGRANNSVTIIDSFNSGNIVANWHSIGGLIGVAGGGTTLMQNVYNSGLINTYATNSESEGGFVGATSHTTKFYVYSSINFSGRIIGGVPNESGFDDSYYYGKDPENSAIFGIKIIDFTIFNLAFFTTTLGWDTDIWDFTGLDIANGVYPTLKNMPVVED